MKQNKNTKIKSTKNNKLIKKPNKEKNLDELEITQINKIFQKLMHFPASSFSDLWEKDITSNKFSYYLKKMENQNLIEKKDEKYFLTLKGKKEAATTDGSTGIVKKRPYIAMLLAIKKGDKYVLYKRMKEPYYGNSGFPGAKLEMGEEILSAAKRELLEETGLICDGKLIGIQNLITYNNDELFAHMVQYIILFENPNGKLVNESREGTYYFKTKKEILSQKKLFPDIPKVIDDIENKKFSVREVKVFQKDEKFIGIEIKEN